MPCCEGEPTDEGHPTADKGRPVSVRRPLSSVHVWDPADQTAAQVTWKFSWGLSPRSPMDMKACSSGAGRFSHPLLGKPFSHFCVIWPNSLNNCISFGFPRYFPLGKPGGKTVFPLFPPPIYIGGESGKPMVGKRPSLPHLLALRAVHQSPSPCRVASRD